MKKGAKSSVDGTQHINPVIHSDSDTSGYILHYHIGRYRREDLDKVRGRGIVIEDKQVNENGEITVSMKAFITGRGKGRRRMIQTQVIIPKANVEEDENDDDDEDDDEGFITDAPFFSTAPPAIDYYADQEIARIVTSIWRQYEDEGFPPNEIADKVISDMLGAIRVKNSQHNLIFDAVAEQYGDKASREDHNYMLLKNLRAKVEDDDH